MFLIVKEKGGYRAILIRPEDSWDLHKVKPGRTEVRIVLRVRGRRYQLFNTCSLTEKHPTLKPPQLEVLCNEIIEILTKKMVGVQEYINIEMIAGAVVLKYRKRWISSGLIPLTSLEEYYGHPIDDKTDSLVSHVHVDIVDLVHMDHEPPINDIGQVELPY